MKPKLFPEAHVNPTITVKGFKIGAGDLMDRGMDKLRTVHLALSPDNKGWIDGDVLQSVWATLEHVIQDLEPVRNYIHGYGDEE